VIGWILPSYIDWNNTHLFIAMCSTEFIMMFWINAGICIVTGFSVVPGQVLFLVPVHLGGRPDPSTTY
jgi:hypothetical protein